MSNEGRKRKQARPNLVSDLRLFVVRREGFAALPSARLIGFALARLPLRKPEGLRSPFGFESL